jgi:very-short-patch-repair endonuclease
MQDDAMTVSIAVDIDPCINYALQQNDVPVVRSLRIENAGDVDIEDLEISIRAEPAFASEWTARISRINACSRYALRDVKLLLSPGFLAGLSERVKGILHFEVCRGKEVLCHEDVGIALLASDEWPGLRSLPENLAAFVLPNHAIVELILKNAAQRLGKWTGDSSFSGYQHGGPRRAAYQTAAIYATLARLKLSYINPPASFEREGQRIRLPDRIVQSKMATCLDITALAVACLEQAGLNPLILIAKNHAYAGVWLKEECFPEPSVDDVHRIKKRADLREILVFDPVCLTSDPSLDFSAAVSSAKQRLEQLPDFLCAIDIQRARRGGIRPLPQGSAKVVKEAPSMAAPHPAGPEGDFHDLPDTADGEVGPPIEAPKTRLETWSRKLLDLSLRNKLINFKETKKTIPFLCPNLSALEDALSDGAEFKILARPPDFGTHDPRDAGAVQRSTGENPLLALVAKEMGEKRLRADLADTDLNRRLLGIYRQARTNLEEGGSSGLFLVLGYLSWFEPDKKDPQQRRAPILLLPVELKRKSVREGFSISLSDEDPRINVSLLEMLSQHHEIHVTGLDPLPTDESGLDVPKILNRLRRAIKDVPRWDVLDDIAHIGIFSFSKILMWKDLVEREKDLLKNAVVNHLVYHPNEPFEGADALPDAKRLDLERSPNDTFCPLSADSSQLAAVFAAAMGLSFVLHGPPGTGKSQTITNLIAHCIAARKTVLFISEKMAALNVVHRRLKSLGIDRYCLELHSNKTRKKSVLAQLARALEKDGDASPKAWMNKGRRLASFREQLNGYVEALHQKRETGESVFEGFMTLIANQGSSPVSLEWPSTGSFNEEKLQSLIELVDRIAATGKSCGDLAKHPWGSSRRADWSPGWEEKVTSARAELLAALKTLRVSVEPVARHAGLGEGEWSFGDLGVLGDFASLMSQSPAIPRTLILESDRQEVERRVKTWSSHGMRRDELRGTLYEAYDPRVLELDLAALETTLGKSRTSWWPLSWIRLRAVRKSLGTATKDRSFPPKENLASDLLVGIELCKEEKLIRDALAAGQASFGGLWKGGDPDWVELLRVFSWTQKVRLLAQRAAGEDIDRFVELLERWAKLVTEGRELLSENGEIGKSLAEFLLAYKGFLESLQGVNELLDLDASRAWTPDKGFLARVEETLGVWEAKATRLRQWCAWQRVRGEALTEGLNPLISACEAGTIPPAELSGVFLRSFYAWWVGAITDAEPALREFFSPEHELSIQKFQKADHEFRNLTRSVILTKLKEKVPSAGHREVRNSEMGILSREIQKRTRHMAIRTLFQKIPTLLPRLKPCLLMSPISVAQYLDASYPPFDIVVFDEASQIPVWDAIGAIARGAQAIIVGDPKQLPPTTFFQRVEAADDEPDEEGIEDLESILDDCLAARLPQLYLDWHYRSRHESLITFSNTHYYDQKLETFPSPDPEGMGVAWRHVPDGVYDKGKTRTNRVEAEEVVREIRSRLTDPARSRRSIGVVTFSQAQQNLIEDLLETARQEDPEIDRFFSEDALEPVFVKNLENVQGDERDVILFSVCYGPDGEGRISMNFGPMNREGGERRLNVAVTRARREVLVFSTLKAEQIDLNRTKARGVADLKAFLEYAEHGHSALALEESTTGHDAEESPFSELVSRLKEKGFAVRTRIGCSGFRIDLAVAEADARDTYILGIVCDGKNYAGAKTARDRDILREEVLKSLGWALHRIWMPDWWRDPEAEILKVMEALDAAQAEKAKGPVSKTRPVNSTREVKVRNEPVETGLPPSEAASLPVYVPMVRPQPLSNPDAFYDKEHGRRIQKAMVEVVRFEGPISLHLLARRVASYWGIERVSKKVVSHITDLLHGSGLRLARSRGGDFLWPGKTLPKEYKIFRVPGAHEISCRNPSDLPLEEVANAAVHILEAQISLPVEDMVREMGKLFGFKRTGRKVKERMELGIDKAVRTQRAVREGDKVKVVE